MVTGVKRMEKALTDGSNKQLVPLLASRYSATINLPKKKNLTPALHKINKTMATPKHKNKNNGKAKNKAKRKRTKKFMKSAKIIKKQRKKFYKSTFVAVLLSYRQRKSWQLKKQKKVFFYWQ